MKNQINNINPEISTMLLQYPVLAYRELFRRSFFEFFVYFWSEISQDELQMNWHIQYLCQELQEIAERVGNNEKKKYDLIINVPPGTTKTSIVMKMFPVWCWTRWHHFRFITASYSQVLSLESGEASRDLIRSDKFRNIYPELIIKDDKDVKSNYRVVKLEYVNKGHCPRHLNGGNRYSTSVGGSVTGFHGHILIVDDPLNPHEAVSQKKIQTTNHWIDQVISTRKVDKEVTPMILIMQRLHQNDPSGHLLSKKKLNIKHISLPATLDGYADQVKPPELKQFYRKGLLDPIRMNRKVLDEMFIDLGQYGFAGQMGQNPIPYGGGMFKVEQFIIIHQMPQSYEIDKVVRFWDKAGSKDSGAYTAGVKMAKLVDGRFVVMDVVRGQWGADERETKILSVAQADGKEVSVWIEQEPGSGGKESADATIRRLAGFNVHKELPKGDKVYRADPYSVQVNWGNVMLLYGEWNHDFIEEHRNFPLGKYKDQVDASAAAFAQLVSHKKAKML